MGTLSQALSMNQRRGQSPGGRTEYVNNELGYEVRLEMAIETVQGGTIFNGSMNLNSLAI